MQDVPSEDSRDPPTIFVFIQQIYKTVNELSLDLQTFPYDHEFTERIFVEDAPSAMEVEVVLSLSLAFIRFQHFSKLSLFGTSFALVRGRIWHIKVIPRACLPWGVLPSSVTQFVRENGGQTCKQVPANTAELHRKLEVICEVTLFTSSYRK
ncbi:hypothetical protein TcWFU_008379 [Taenia crassiceps]|uniref:Uncharacterized protein n=1 Tax=Taenia crassiceps TaxID=6207 RepID=A0ABR4Q444_9CEST